VKKLKVLDHETLVMLNRSSIQAGRSQNLRPEQLPTNPQERYPVNFHTVHQRGGQQDIRMCVVLDTAGQTAWLDVSSEEFAAIPEVEISELIWGATMCAGTPPPAP